MDSILNINYLLYNYNKNKKIISFFIGEKGF